MTARTTYPWEAAASGPAAALATQLEQLVPTLETERLVLRAPRLSDFEAYAGILGSQRATYMNGPFDREAAWLDFCQYTAMWMLRGAGMFTVLMDDAIVGFATMGMEFGDREHELGYFLTADAEGKGIATEAAAALRDFALGTHGLPSLVSYIDPDNAASEAIVARIGAARDTAAEAEFDEPVHVWRHTLGGTA